MAITTGTGMLLDPSDQRSPRHSYRSTDPYRGQYVVLHQAVNFRSAQTQHFLQVCGSQETVGFTAADGHAGWFLFIVSEYLSSHHIELSPPPIRFRQLNATYSLHPERAAA
jgi:hypothetical protein